MTKLRCVHGMCLGNKKNMLTGQNVGSMTVQGNQSKLPGTKKSSEGKKKYKRRDSEQ